MFYLKCIEFERCKMFPAAQNPSDTSNQSVDDLIKPLPAMIIEDDEESRKFELTISDRNKSLSGKSVFSSFF